MPKVCLLRKITYGEFSEFVREKKYIYLVMVGSRGVGSGWAHVEEGISRFLVWAVWYLGKSSNMAKNLGGNFCSIFVISIPLIDFGHPKNSIFRVHTQPPSLMENLILTGNDINKRPVNNRRADYDEV